MVTETRPDYALFLRSASAVGKWNAMLDAFVATLEPGEPELIPDALVDHYGSAPKRSEVGALGMVFAFAGKRAKCELRVRKIDGKLWVCKLKPEDAQ